MSHWTHCNHKGIHRREAGKLVIRRCPAGFEDGGKGQEEAGSLLKLKKTRGNGFLLWMKNIACHICKQRPPLQPTQTVIPEETQDGDKQTAPHQALSHCCHPQVPPLPPPKGLRKGKKRILTPDSQMCFSVAQFCLTLCSPRAPRQLRCISK